MQGSQSLRKDEINKSYKYILLSHITITDSETTSQLLRLSGFFLELYENQTGYVIDNAFIRANETYLVKITLSTCIWHL